MLQVQVRGTLADFEADATLRARRARRSAAARRRLPCLQWPQEVIGVRDGCAPDGRDDVEHPQSCLLRRGAGNDLNDDDTFVDGQIELTYVRLVHAVIPNSDKRPDDHAACSTRSLSNRLGLVDRNGEAYALGVRSYGGVDADGLARKLSSGPPLLPGLMAASVCIKLRYVRVRRCFPIGHLRFVARWR